MAILSNFSIPRHLYVLIPFAGTQEFPKSDETKAVLWNGHHTIVEVLLEIAITPPMA